MGTSGEVVLGLGSCVDYEVAWDEAVVQRLVEQYGITASEVDRSVPVESERDLVRSIVAFLRDGVGGERFVASSEIVTAYAARFPHRARLGGTNVRAAIAMSRLGLRSTLHLVSIDATVRDLLPPQISYICSAAHDSSDPHLVVQFPAGATVRVGEQVYRSPHPNRLIYVNDPPNREMVLSDDLGPLLENARIFLISGFNTVRDETVLARRLGQLRSHLRRLPADAVVIFEDAGYHVPAMSARVRDALVDRIDVYGMNEDEMFGHLGRSMDLLDAYEVAQALGRLHDTIPAGVLVVHTKYWALAHAGTAETYRAALESATALAAARFLRGDDFTAQDYHDLRRSPGHPAGRAFAAALEGLVGDQGCCVPAIAVSTQNPTTIGLGDAFVGGFVAGLAGPVSPG